MTINRKKFKNGVKGDTTMTPEPIETEPDVEHSNTAGERSEVKSKHINPFMNVLLFQPDKSRSSPAHLNPTGFVLNKKRGNARRLVVKSRLNPEKLEMIEKLKVKVISRALIKESLGSGDKSRKVDFDECVYVVHEWRFHPNFLNHDYRHAFFQ